MPNTGLFGLWAVVPTGIVIDPVPVNVGFDLKVRVITRTMDNKKAA